MNHRRLTLIDVCIGDDAVLNPAEDRVSTVVNTADHSAHVSDELGTVIVRLYSSMDSRLCNFR